MMMKIEIWSDFVCPFCYIGEKKLKQVIDSLPFLTDVEISFKSFELDPNAPLYNGKKIHEALAEKYNMSVEQAKAANDNINQHAGEVGLTFDFEEMKPTNTLDAHRLAKYASEKGLETEMTDALFSAYFEKGELISDTDTLVAIAKTAGIAEEESSKVLADPTLYFNDVRGDEQRAQQLGITGAPYFVIDDKYAISGAQPVELFIKALTDAWASQATAAKPATDGAVCDENGCTI